MGTVRMAWNGVHVLKLLGSRMSGTVKINSVRRSKLLLLILFLSPILQAADLDSPELLEINNAALNWKQSLQSGLAGMSDVGNVRLFEMPLIGRITGFGFRQGTADGGRFADLDLQAAFVDFRLPWRWSPWRNMTVTPRLTLEVGRFSNDFEQRTFRSLGPTFRFERNLSSLPLFLDLGLSATTIDGVQYGDRDLGTSFNFTSHVALGLRFGPNQNNRVSLRYQHISNGGIDSTNPGMNSFGLDVVVWSRR